MTNPAVFLIKRAASLTAIAIIFTISAFAQSNTGTITGR